LTSHLGSARAARGRSPRRGFELRKIADAPVASRDHTPSVLSAATPTPTREQRLWSEEVARVYAKAPTLDAAARRAVRATLHALANDPSTDEVTRADAVAMLSATAPLTSSGEAPPPLSNGGVWRGGGPNAPALLSNWGDESSLRNTSIASRSPAQRLAVRHARPRRRVRAAWCG
jgi:hypothetical protein